MNDEIEQPEEESGTVLSKAEIAKAREEAFAKIRRERKAELKKELMATFEHDARIEMGLQKGDKLRDELVQVKIDLAPYTDRIRVNNRTTYWHGMTYTVPEHVAASLREICSRSWAHQAEIDGKSILQNRERGISVSPHGTQGTAKLPGFGAAA